VGARRAELVVALQSALMRAVGEFGEDPAFEPHRARVLATAAALDYVLMLASGTAGVRIPERDAERAMREGIARGVDDLLSAAGAIAKSGTPQARAFAREAGASLRTVVRAEGLESDERTFGLIALANA
jgi:hypothetical protein